MSYDRRSETMEDEHKIASLLIRWRDQVHI